MAWSRLHIQEVPKLAFEWLPSLVLSVCSVQSFVVWLGTHYCFYICLKVCVPVLHKNIHDNSSRFKRSVMSPELRGTETLQLYTHKLLQWEFYSFFYTPSFCRSPCGKAFWRESVWVPPWMTWTHSNKKYRQIIELYLATGTLPH